MTAILSPFRADITALTLTFKEAIMRFTEEKINAINEALLKKKKAKPISHNVIGIGVHINNSICNTFAFSNNWQICDIEDISRMIEELTMLKEAIEEETGIVL